MSFGILTKNLDFEYREEFRLRGKVLLSSLKRLREKEGAGSDELEGIKTLTIRPNETQRFVLDEVQQFFPPNVSISGQGAYLQIAAGANANFATYLPDAYVYCASTNRLNQFGDSSYRILDPDGFARTLKRALQIIDPMVYGYKTWEVVYGDFKEPVNDLAVVFQKNYSLRDITYKDYFCKPKRFESESEYRFVFFTKADQVPDVTFVCSTSLVSFCDFETAPGVYGSSRDMKKRYIWEKWK